MQKEMKKHTFMTFQEGVEFVIGLGIFSLSITFFIISSILIKTWEKVDRLFQGKPRSGFYFKMCNKINEITKSKLEQYVIYKEDYYIINAIIGLGTTIPLLFLASAYYTQQYGFSVVVCLIYHVIRLGPDLFNFSSVQTLCHKEGHAGSDQFHNCPYLIKEFLGNAFCWWIGPFYGILPYSFKIGHSINHHRFNNSKRDTINNSDMERDSVINFTRYILRFFLYSTNISLLPEFYRDRQYMQVAKLASGICIYSLFFYLSAVKVSLVFALVYIGYPFLENVYNISAYNWTWHAFIDPEDPTNEYANSITIIDGSYNMIDRDLHVVHHAFPGVHWSKYRKIFENDKESYIQKKASLFQETQARELFFLIIFKRYNTMAEKFVYSQPLSHEEKIKFIKRRLRSITWGRKQNVYNVTKID